MKKTSAPSADRAALRRAAERRLKERPTTDPPPTEAALRRLQHELEVHQIELEMQNEELRAAQTEIAATLERYTDLYDFAPVGYVNLSDDGTILLVNLTGAKLMGIERDRLVGRRFELFVVDADRPAFRSALDHAFTTGTRWICELALERKDRPSVTIRLEVALSPDAKEGRAVMTDLSELRQLEDQIRQSQKMEAIGQLAGGVAHDFNNMLAAITMQTELAATAQNAPEEVREGLRQIRVYTERAADLTRQLLLFSRRQVMEPSDLDLNEVVTGLARMLQRIIGDDVQLLLQLHRAPLMIRADAGMLNQVLMNLAVNARDAMAGGGRLLIETAARIVDEDGVRSQPDAVPGRYAWLSVSDTGSGIAPEVLPHVFEPFFTTKEPAKGTGLGLATVFGIVKQHRGWLTVASEPGHGAHFQIFLPATAATGVEVVGAVAHPKPCGGTETILLAEDEPSVRSLTRRLLEHNGYRVLEVANGAEALAVWQEHAQNVALLLTDLVMPGGMNGHQLAQRLRMDRPDLKIVFTSGYSADIAGYDFALQERENFIQKPFSPRQLLETLRRCLNG